MHEKQDRILGYSFLSIHLFLADTYPFEQSSYRGDSTSMRYSHVTKYLDFDQIFERRRNITKQITITQIKEKKHINLAWLRQSKTRQHIQSVSHSPLHLYSSVHFNSALKHLHLLLHPVSGLHLHLISSLIAMAASTRSVQ